ncbi:hypothetical protein ITP53_23415 [Nonomuraea sp. K274]|uniref:Uncharacterized protein n=1 Tax=Nonomuraea cypriaca TaxID=1187855 RepID=A0A931A925_9ACTN|nr:hypothetical protein [Nonomuraea cypriaca]MBF8188622.1 hypothetical protein [Nonomuraea cypriaca]
MSTSYPIISQDLLPPVDKRGLFGLRGRARPAADIPKARTHEAVVVTDGVTYTSGKQRRLSGDDEHLVNATSYCVVDMTRDKPITVQLALQSSGVDQFTLRVTFACTVTDEITVAQVGHRDLDEAVLAYLKGYHRLYQLGLEHPIDAVLKVQDDAQIELGVYAQTCEPKFRGMDVRLSSVEVLTPAAVLEEQRKLEERLKAHEQQERELELERALRTKQRSYEQDDQIDAHRFTRELAREEGETERERLDRLTRERRLTRDHEREEADFTHEQRQGDLAAELRRGRMLGEEVARDPYAAISLAMARGELSPSELMRRADEETRRRREEDQAERLAQRERLHLQLDREWEEDTAGRHHKRQLETSRQELEAKLAERDSDHGHERIRLEMERESRLQQWDVTREERQREHDMEKLRLEHTTQTAQQQLAAGREDTELEWTRERVRLEHQKTLRQQDLENLREERKWKDEKEQQAWEREQNARDRELKMQIAQSLINRGQGDHTDLTEVIFSVLQDVTGTPHTAIVVEDVQALETVDDAATAPAEGAGQKEQGSSTPADAD